MDGSVSDIPGTVLRNLWVFNQCVVTNTTLTEIGSGVQTKQSGKPTENGCITYRTLAHRDRIVDTSGTSPRRAETQVDACQYIFGRWRYGIAERG
jgi:hypothetical protein